MDTTGIALAILSALFMGTIGVFSRITGLPAETITFFRLLLGAGWPPRRLWRAWDRP